MSYLIVLPSIWPPFTEACVASLHPTARDCLMVVDNTGPGGNRGVAASWNMGVDRVLAERVDWVVLLSAAVRFGRPGGLDFLDWLAEAPAWVLGVEAADGTDSGALGWHLIAFHRDTLEKVGRFDEQFWPAYHEDLDFSYRTQLAYRIDGHFKSPFLKYPCDGRIAMAAHGICLAHVTIDFIRNQDRYVNKWGGPSGHEVFTTPYGDPYHDWTWCGLEAVPGPCLPLGGHWVTDCPTCDRRWVDEVA